MYETVVSELTKRGVLRAAVNLQNSQLITGRNEQGAPTGVAPGMAGAIAKRLGASLELIEYASAKLLSDKASEWDIGFVGAAPEREGEIQFTAAYCEIESTFLVRESAPFNSVSDVFRAGVRIAVSSKSGYGLWLTRNVADAELVCADSAAESKALFIDNGLDALAGLRPSLAKTSKSLEGTRVLTDNFTVIRQAIGTRKNNKAMAGFLSEFVEEAKRSGLVAKLIDRYEAHGLSVAPLA